MAIVFERYPLIYMVNFSKKNFSGFMENLRLTMEFYAKNYVICLCCVLTYQNITSNTSTFTKYKSVQEMEEGYPKKMG